MMTSFSSSVKDISQKLACSVTEYLAEEANLTG